MGTILRGNVRRVETTYLALLIATFVVIAGLAVHILFRLFASDGD